MKKVLFLNRNGLIDPLVSKLAETHTVVVLQREGRTEPELPGVHLAPINYRDFSISYICNTLLGKQVSIPVCIKNFTELVATEAPDVIVAFDFYHLSYWQALVYKQRHPATKLILLSETKQLPSNLASRLLFRLFWNIFARNIHLIDNLAVFTQQGKNFFKKNLPQKPAKLIIIPVDTKDFYPVPEKICLPDGALRILMNARYEPYKRHEDVLYALLQLQSQGKKVHLTCIGRAKSGRDRVELLVEKLNLQKSVTFLDPVTKKALPAIYHEHDVLVLPSYNEAIGMVVPEAMACGMPTVTSDTVGANVYVKEGETGFIFETGDTKALANALESLYDESKLKDMGIAARSRVETIFSISSCQHIFTQLFIE